MEAEPKPLTITELAERLGVSAMTVHRAIAGKPDISARTRTRILDEIERLGWRPNLAARGLKRGKTFALGILVSNVAASFLPEVLQGVNLAAEAEGYHTFVSVHEHDLARAEGHLLTLQSKGVDGIVYYPTLTGAEAALLNQIYRSTPLVAMMREVPGFQGPVVLIDDRKGGRLAAEHLLELGHCKIGFLGYQDAGFSTLRRQGFEAALWERGVELPREWTDSDLVPGDTGSRERARRILSAADRPTALFCVSDRIAARVLQAALELGIRVPEQLSLIGYNDDPIAQLLAVPLTTIAQPRRRVGEEAARLVLQQEPGVGSAARLMLDPSLVQRESTASPAL